MTWCRTCGSAGRGPTGARSAITAERTLQAPRRIAGHELPAGIRVYPNIVAVHYREDLYPEATTFRPERFLDGRTSTYTWLPFGGGSRRCIGAALAEAEIAEVVRVVLSRVQLRKVGSGLDRVVMRGITLVPRHVCRSRSPAGRTVAPSWARARRGRWLDRGASGAYPYGGELLLQPSRV